MEEREAVTDIHRDIVVLGLLGPSMMCVFDVIIVDIYAESYK